MTLIVYIILLYSSLINILKYIRLCESYLSNILNQIEYRSANMRGATLMS